MLSTGENTKGAIKGIRSGNQDVTRFTVACYILLPMNDKLQRLVQFHKNRLGQELAYQYLPGKQPMVVFLSGYASDMTGSKAEHLSEHCVRRGQAFLRLDYSGHGQSAGNFSDGSIGRWAEDAQSIIEYVNRSPCVLVGSSMGAWIMLVLAKKMRRRVKGLIGIAAAPDFTKDLIWNGLDDKQRETLVAKGEIYLTSQDTDDALPVTWRLIEDGNDRLLLNDVIHLSCPVRLIHGVSDTDVPWTTSMRLSQQLESQDVSLILIKDGEHRLSRSSDLATIVSVLDALLEYL